MGEWGDVGRVQEDCGSSESSVSFMWLWACSCCLLNASHRSSRSVPSSAAGSSVVAAGMRIPFA